MSSPKVLDGQSWTESEEKSFSHPLQKKVPLHQVCIGRADISAWPVLTSSERRKREDVLCSTSTRWGCCY